MVTGEGRSVAWAGLTGRFGIPALSQPDAAIKTVLWVTARFSLAPLDDGPLTCKRHVLSFDLHHLAGSICLYLCLFLITNGNAHWTPASQTAAREPPILSALLAACLLALITASAQHPTPMHGPPPSTALLLLLLSVLLSLSAPLLPLCLLCPAHRPSSASPPHPPPITGLKPGAKFNSGTYGNGDEDLDLDLDALPQTGCRIFLARVRGVVAPVLSPTTLHPGPCHARAARARPAV